MLHFGRRGRENLATLTRQDFAVSRDDEGLMYVYKTTDEQTKNHQDDSQKSSDGRMYEVKGKQIYNNKKYMDDWMYKLMTLFNKRSNCFCNPCL